MLKTLSAGLAINISAKQVFQKAAAAIERTA
jgi:hypothetical protein